MEKRMLCILERIRSSLLYIILLFCTSLYGQEKCSILGYVHEFVSIPSGGLTSTPVIGFEAILFTGTDTLRVTSRNGDFQFRDLEPATYTLHVAKGGYIPFEDKITLKEGDQAITIELLRKGEELEKAVVCAFQPVLSAKGDTLVFHANAVKKIAGDFAIDLIAQMPGAELSDVGIKIGGKTVSRALVNGVLVFGRDPMDALRNLAAEEVLTMEVYDEAPINTNNVTAQKERVINIHTKNPILEVTDIQSLLSGGADSERKIDGDLQKRFLMGFSGNFFSEDLQIKADANTNNLGIAKSVALGADAFSTPATELTSQSAVNSAGINIEKYWGRNYATRTGLTFGYSYNDSYTLSPNKSIVEHFETDLTPARTITDSTTNINSIRKHTVTSGFQKTFGNIRISWSNNMNILRNKDAMDTERETRISENSYIENSNKKNEENSWAIKENLSFSGTGRESNNPYILSFDIGANKGGNSGFILDTLSSSSSRRYLNMAGDRLNWNAATNLNYSKRFKKAKYQEMLVFKLSSSYASDASRQTGFDILGSSHSIDKVNTFDYTYNALTNKAGITFQRLFFQGGLSVWHSLVTDTERIPSDGEFVRKSYLSLVPFIYLYNGKGLDMRINSSVQLPSLEQLRKRIDNTNPYSVIAGNPNLNAAKSYILSINKAGTGMDLRRLLLSATYTTDPIVRKEKQFLSSSTLAEYDSYVMPAGSTLHYYENADWALSARISYADSKGIDFNTFKMRPFSMNYSIEAGTSVNPAYLAEQMYRSFDTGADAHTDFTYTPNESLRISFMGDIRIDRMSNTISKDVINSLGWGYGAVLMFNPWRYGFFEAQYRNNSDMIMGNTAMSNNFLKVSVGTKLLSQKLTIMLEGVDLLDNSSMFSTSYTENSFAQYFKPVYGQYLLLSVKYRFNSSQNRSFVSSFRSGSSTSHDF